MVQSLNVSVAAAILLFESIRQRELKGLIPSNGEGLNNGVYENTLFEWCYPKLINYYKNSGKEYPRLDKNGEICK